jgi:hypothetical protein
MCQHLRNILAVPLCARNLNTTVNPFDGRLDSTGTNGAKLFSLKVIVIDNAMAMFASILTEILSLFLLALLKQGNGLVNLTFPKQSLCLVQPLEGSADFMEIFAFGDTNLKSLVVGLP